MTSPFPGMDPWLEDEEVFPNVHERIGVYLQDALNAILPPGYAATTKNRVWVDPELRREPDVGLFGRERPGYDSPQDGGLAVATLTRSGLLEVDGDAASDPIEEPYLEIRSNRGKRLVTAVEVLSRSNKKPGDAGRESYLNKQLEYRASAVNVVEIDLLRAGPHTTAVPRDRLKLIAPEPFEYHVCVTVPTAHPKFFVAPIRLIDRLPVIPIPLDWDIPPVSVDLQAVFDRCYDGGRYPELVNYAAPPDPPLTPAQQAWADALLNAKGVTP